MRKGYYACALLVRLVKAVLLEDSLKSHHFICSRCFLGIYNV